MTTKLIGIKDFRANMSKYAKQARKGDIRFIVMNRNDPLFEIKPFEEKIDLESIFIAKNDIKKGRIHSQEDILAEFA